MTGTINSAVTADFARSLFFTLVLLTFVCLLFSCEMVLGSHVHRRSAWALHRRSSAAGISAVPDVNPRSVPTAINPDVQDNGDGGSNSKWII